MFGSHIPLPIPMGAPWMGMPWMGGVGSPYGVPPPAPSPLHWHEFQVYDVVHPGALKVMQEDIRSGLAEVARSDYITFTTPCTLLPSPNLPVDFYGRPIGQMRFAIGKTSAWTEDEKRVVLTRLRKDLKIGGVTGMKDWNIRPPSVRSRFPGSGSGSGTGSSSSVLSHAAKFALPGEEPVDYKVSRWLVKREGSTMG